MKKVSIVIPTLNEEENVVLLVEEIIEQFKEIKEYDYEILFIDNFSTDKTRMLIESLCEKNNKVKAIFNARNFGGIKSPIYGMLQATGDSIITMCADFQNPVNLIPKFIKEWEKGYKVVCGIKESSKENKIMRFIRTCYYNFIKKISDIEQIKYFDGVGLYDREAIELLRQISERDSEVQLRSFVPDLGIKYGEVRFEQQKRQRGRSKNGLYVLYMTAFNVITSCTQILPRLPVFIGGFLGMIGIAGIIISGILNITNGFSDKLLWGYIGGGIFILFAIQLFFVGILGEYIIIINSRSMNRPLVIEDKRINF
jgi:glycosyltransferase involved in cell wall biosynthesis